jgi:hypothetical protein
MKPEEFLAAPPIQSFPDRLLSVKCSECGAEIGQLCKDVPLSYMRHNARKIAYEKQVLS